MENMKLKDLRDLAGELSIIGRWDMNKQQLIEAINLVKIDKTKELEEKTKEIVDIYEIVEEMVEEIIEDFEVTKKERTKEEAIQYLVDYIYVGASFIKETEDGFIFSVSEEDGRKGKVKVFKEGDIENYEVLIEPTIQKPTTRKHGRTRTIEVYKDGILISTIEGLLNTFKWASTNNICNTGWIRNSLKTGQETIPGRKFKEGGYLFKYKD